MTPSTYGPFTVSSFGNVYEWAGEYRTVGMTKNLSEFAKLSDVPRYLDDASRLVRGAQWSTMNRDQFAAKAAEVFAYVNTGGSALFSEELSESSRDAENVPVGSWRKFDQFRTIADSYNITRG
jgi:hypothetical protein